ncbi:MAG: asparagine synthase (glutamine-hydrolyzing) [Planctomycetota bacterium]
MCGIAGILSLSPRTRVDPAELDLMAAPLVHRGPDDQGRYVDPQRRCGLAFRRLSIIDLAGGNQPIANETRTVWTVFNGEIYNFPELRAELQVRGHRFSTRTDTEVIVHLYEEHGEGCFERLAGMFALALWDERRGRLLLARDRFGKKPLTYAVHDERLYFASEAKAILALPGVPRDLDPQSLHRYLIFQYVPAPHSIYRDFSKLLPGHYLTLEASRPLDDRPRAYWRLEPRPFAGNYDDAKARLGELLTAAVRKRLIADVPLGAFLSGGVDSSIVVALMRALGVSPLRTFSIGFPDPRYDETTYARRVAERFGTEHHEHVVTPEAREILDLLAWHFDEPFADSSAIPTYYVSRWTRQYVTVALSGDAGDECFAGYDRYRAVQLAARLDILPRALRSLFAAGAGLAPHAHPRTFGNRLHRFATALAGTPVQRYLAWVNVFPPALLADGYAPEFRARLDLDEPRAWLARLYDAHPGPAADRAMHADFHSYLPYDLLTKVDIASMACSLECRAPFLDHELVEFARALPLEWRLARRGGKHILKDWARGRVPDVVLHRPKMGFGVPVGQWFRRELADLLRDRVLASDSLALRIFRPAWLTQLVETHIAGRANYEHPLWALLMLEAWNERWQPRL